MRKLVMICTLILTICFIALGLIFRSTADNHKGVAVTTGIIVDGEFSPDSSGYLGADKEKEEAFNSGGTMFFIFAGITGVIFIVSAISGLAAKKSY